MLKVQISIPLRFGLGNPEIVKSFAHLDADLLQSQAFQVSPGS
jgi:hypothetical protein